MRLPLLPAALLALSLPGPALACPQHLVSVPYGGSPVYDYPMAASPYPSPEPAPVRRCGPGPALIGAAIGGGLGGLLANGARNRRWALPMGAAVGGILGGAMSGCGG